jgi:hypothetical protein
MTLAEKGDTDMHVNTYAYMNTCRIHCLLYFRSLDTDRIKPNRIKPPLEDKNKKHGSRKKVELEFVVNCNPTEIEKDENFPTECLYATHEKHKTLKRETCSKVSKRLNLLLFSSKTTMDESIP